MEVSALTMLFQDDTGGLEVENPLKAGEFMAATPLKNALVLNVGDLLMRWSNGLCWPSAYVGQGKGSTH